MPVAPSRAIPDASVIAPANDGASAIWTTHDGATRASDGGSTTRATDGCSARANDSGSATGAVDDCPGQLHVRPRRCTVRLRVGRKGARAAVSAQHEQTKCRNRKEQNPTHHSSPALFDTHFRQVEAACKFLKRVVATIRLPLKRFRLRVSRDPIVRRPDTGAMVAPKAGRSKQKKVNSSCAARRNLRNSRVPSKARAWTNTEAKNRFDKCTRGRVGAIRWSCHKHAKK